MKWGRVVAVFLVVVMVCGLFVRVPLARASAPASWGVSLTLYYASMATYPTFQLNAGPYGGGGTWASASDIVSWSVTFSTPACTVTSFATSGYPRWGITCGSSPDSFSGRGSVTATFYIVTVYGVCSGSVTASNSGGGDYNYGYYPADQGNDEPFAAVPVSVELSGASSASVGQNYTYSAAISGGTAPYSVVFERSSTAHPADDLVYATQSGSGTSYSQVITFPNVDNSFVVAVTVTDSTNATATDSMTVNASSDKPVVYGAAKLGANGQVEFRATLTPPAGVFPNDSTSLPTSGAAPTMWYTVLTPSWLLRGAYSFILPASSPVANPYVVMISLMDRAGVEWTYVFSFDTSSWSAPGDWSDSTGGTGSDAEIPTWLDSLLNSLRNMLLKLWDTILAALKAMFQWLFVPTDAQMTSLLPSGTMGATLLEGLPEFTGADTSAYTLHTHWTVGGVAKQIDLLTIDLSTLAASGFVSVMKLVIQAGMSLGLIFMVVALI